MDQPGHSFRMTYNRLPGKLALALNPSAGSRIYQPLDERARPKKG